MSDSLMNSTTSYQHAIEAAPNAMLIVDMDGVITFANLAAADLLEGSLEEIVGQNVDTLVPRSTQGHHHQLRASFAKAPVKRKMAETRQILYALTLGGREVPVEIGLTPLSTGEGTKIVCAIVDISDHIRHAESLAQLNRELNLKNKEMERFIYTISHDLKAPLVSISGFTSRLAKADLPATKRERYVTRVQANVDRMNLLLSDLLTLSRVIHRAPESEKVDVMEVLKSLRGSLTSRFYDCGGRLELPSEVDSVSATRVQVVQVFQNLVTNAIKYRREEPLRISIRARTEQSAVHFEVEDNGQGIEPNYLERVFDLFERVNPDDGKEGTGVGLTIVKSIIERYDGTVEVRSTKGEGSTFLFSLPLWKDET